MPIHTIEQFTDQQRDTILRLETLCDSGTWEYDDFDTATLSSQEIPADNLIRHWRVPRVTGEFLYNTVIEHKPMRILELGTSTGYSTLWLGVAASTYGGHIDTVDYFGPKIPIAKQFIAKAGLAPTITQHHIRIKGLLEQTTNVKYDLVFMDADKHNYLNYWELLQPQLSDQFIVIADNASNGARSLHSFVNHCEQDTNLQCEHLTIGTGLFVIRNT